MAAGKLTERQKNFCREYLKDFNATKAYQRAGYKVSASVANASGPRLLTKTNIQSYLCEMREAIAEKADVTRADALKLIHERATADISDVLSFDASGISLNNSRNLPKSVTRNVSSVKFSASDKGDSISVSMRPSDPALKSLSNFFGLETGFDQLREGLKRYGIALIPDQENPTGWTTAVHDDS